MDTRKMELSAEDFSVLVLLQSLDEFEGLKDEYGEEITSLRYKLDGYHASMGFDYEQLEKMDQSINNLEAAGLIMVEPNENEIYIFPQGREAVNVVTENENVCKDSLKVDEKIDEKTGRKGITGLTLDGIIQAIKKIDKDKLFNRFNTILSSCNIVVQLAKFFCP